MTATNSINDIRETTEFAARQWEIYVAAVRRIGDTASLREANEGLGYNLVKTIPGLLQWIQELQDENEKLRRDLGKAKTKVRSNNRESRGLKRADYLRPLGIPEEHLILIESPNVEDEIDDFAVFDT